jgi:hypothetical protein
MLFCKLASFGRPIHYGGLGMKSRRPSKSPPREPGQQIVNGDELVITSRTISYTLLFMIVAAIALIPCIAIFVTLSITYSQLGETIALSAVYLVLATIIALYICRRWASRSEIICTIDARGLVCPGPPDFILPWEEIEFAVPLYRPEMLQYAIYQPHPIFEEERYWKKMIQARRAIVLNTFHPRIVLRDYYKALKGRRKAAQRRFLKYFIMPISYLSDIRDMDPNDFPWLVQWFWHASLDRLVYSEQDATFVIFDRPFRLVAGRLPIDQILRVMTKRGIEIRRQEIEPLL